MLMVDKKTHLTVSESLAPAARTATVNGVSLDTRDYEGDILALLHSAPGGGTSPTLDVKIQDSADDATFADVTGYTFSQITTMASAQKLTVDKRNVRRYVRMAATITGTSPTFTCVGLFQGMKKTL